MHLLLYSGFGEVHLYRLFGYRLSRNNSRKSLSAHMPPCLERLSFEALEVNIPRVKGGPCLGSKLVNLRSEFRRSLLVKRTGLFNQSLDAFTILALAFNGLLAFLFGGNLRPSSPWIEDGFGDCIDSADTKAFGS